MDYAERNAQFALDVNYKIKHMSSIKLSASELLQYVENSASLAVESIELLDAEILNYADRCAGIAIKHAKLKQNGDAMLTLSSTEFLEYLKENASITTEGIALMKRLEKEALNDLTPKHRMLITFKKLLLTKPIDGNIIILEGEYDWNSCAFKRLFAGVYFLKNISTVNNNFKNFSGGTITTTFQDNRILYQFGCVPDVPDKHNLVNIDDDNVMHESKPEYKENVIIDSEINEDNIVSELDIQKVKTTYENCIPCCKNILDNLKIDLKCCCRLRKAIDTDNLDFNDLFRICKPNILALLLCKNVKSIDLAYLVEKTLNAMMRLAIGYGSQKVIKELYNNYYDVLKSKRIVKYIVHNHEVAEIVVGLDLRIQWDDIVLCAINQNKQHTAELFVNKIKKNHQTILEFAAIYGYYDVIRIILQNTTLRLRLLYVYDNGDNIIKELLSKNEYSCYRHPNLWITDNDNDRDRVYEIKKDPMLEELFDQIIDDKIYSFKVAQFSSFKDEDYLVMTNYMMGKMVRLFANGLDIYDKHKKRNIKWDAFLLLATLAWINGAQNVVEYIGETYMEIDLIKMFTT